MKQFSAHLSVFLGLLAIFFIAIPATAQQSLGEAARRARQSKPAEPPAKVITNDDLSSLPASAVTTATDSSASTEKKDVAAQDKDKDKNKEAEKKELSPEDQAKLDKDWGDKIAAQKDAISLLERELDVLQRENKLRASNYYADAGTRLRDSQKYAEDDRKYRDQIDAKQKELDDAKSKLEQMKDDARKAGASPGAIS
jgi:hypothetical protein